MSHSSWPANNGEAERFVQIFKYALKASQQDPGTLVQKLLRFLLMYWTTPHTTMGVSPVKVLEWTGPSYEVVLNG